MAIERSDAQYLKEAKPILDRVDQEYNDARKHVAGNSFLIGLEYPLPNGRTLLIQRDSIGGNKGKGEYREVGYNLFLLTGGSNDENSQVLAIKRFSYPLYGPVTPKIGTPIISSIGPAAIAHFSSNIISKLTVTAQPNERVVEALRQTHGIKPIPVTASVGRRG